MSNKLNLEVGRGNGFDQSNRYSLKFDIKNFDTTTIPLSALRITSYGWLPQRNILSQFTSGVNSTGLLSQFTSSVDSYYGIGQTGTVFLNLTDNVYRVTHNVVNSSKISPQLTIHVPYGEASIGTVSFINATDTYFDIVIDDPPANVGYSITWFLPGSYEEYTGSTTPIQAPTISIEKLVNPFVRNKSKKADTKFTFAWPGSTTLIPQNWGVGDLDFYVSFPNLYPSNLITSAWYSKPEENVLDNPYFILEQFNGVSWQVVSEYDSSTTLDAQTGIVPSDPYFLNVESSATGKSVYISTTSGNPIAGTVSDRNYLSLWSKGSGDNRRRSLVKFTPNIPSSATSIKSAVLRLNVNSLSNAWNYTGTNGHVGVYRVTSDWTENEATWINRKTGTPWTISGGDYLDSPAVWIGNSVLSNSFTSADQDSQFWIDFDVTSFVDYWRLNPAQNYGLLIKLFDPLNENNITDIKWTLDSSRTSGSGSVLAYPQLLVSYNVLNPAGPVPTLVIKEPVENEIIPTNTFNVSVESFIAGGSVETVDLYQRPKNSISPYIFLQTLSTNNYVDWFGDVSSLSFGEYDIVARGTSDLGNVGESLPIRISFVQTPSTTFQTNGLCHTSTIDIAGTVETTFVQPVSGYLQYTFQDIPSDKKVTKIIEDKIHANVIWIATEGNGLFRLDKTTNNIVRINSSNSPLISDYIADMDIESNGTLWLSLRNQLDQSGLGLVSFNTLNYNSFTNNDFVLYNTVNSPLSAFSPTQIDINSIKVDSNGYKWLSLTWASRNNIVRFSGNIFDYAHTVYFDLEVSPRKIESKSGIVYVLTNDTRMLVYNGGWNTYTFSNNVLSVYPETTSKIWVGTENGLALLDSAVVSEVQSSATPAFPNGLNSNVDHNLNKKINSIFVDSLNNKWLGFSTGNGEEFNGGFVRYAGSNLSTPVVQNVNNWKCYDKSNYSGLVSNDINQILVTTDYTVWVSTNVGLESLTNYTWANYSKTFGKKYDLTISGNNYSAQISEPKFGNTSFDVVFDYSNTTLTSSFTASIEKDLNLLVNYPVGNFTSVSSNVSTKVYEVETNNYDDVSNGNNLTLSVYKAPSESGPWTLFRTVLNEANPSISDTLIPEQFYYLKTIVQGTNCSDESDVSLVYGRNLLIISADNLSGSFSTKDVMNFSGTVYDKDFSNTLTISGRSYRESIQNIIAGYTSGTNFVQVGYANYTEPTNNNVSFNFTWNNPVANISALQFKVNTSFGASATTQSTFSSIVSVPTISIISPIQNQSISLNSSTILSAQATYDTYSVSSVAFYLLNGLETVFVGSATSASGYWTKSLTPSAISANGNYTLYASAVDVNGTSNVSNGVDISINSLPTFRITSNLSASHTGTLEVVGKISDSNGYYNNKIEILSGATVYSSGYSNSFGDFIWNWVNPPNGISTLSAKVYDGNPGTSSDYSITELKFDLNKVTVSIVDPGFASAKLNNITYSPKVNVVRANENFNISATIVGSNVDYVNYWLCELNSLGVFEKKSILTTAMNPYVGVVSLPSSRYFSSPFISEYKFYGIIAEVVSFNGTKIESETIRFYSKEQSLTGDIYTNTCSNPIIFTGSVTDSDLPYYTVNPIVDNVVTAEAYSTSALGTIDLGLKNDENRDYYFSWTNPVSSTSAIEIRLTDSYGISATRKIVYGQIEAEPVLTISAIPSQYYISAVGNAYLVSASTIQLSSYSSSNYVSAFNYVQTYIDNSRKVTSASVSKPHTSSITLSANDQYVLVNADYYTSGKCQTYSTNILAFSVLNSATMNLVVDNCSDCYCSSGTLKISGTIFDNNFENALLNNVFSYATSAYLYDNLNNLLLYIPVSETNTSFVFNWSNPTIGVNSVKLRMVNSYGIVSEFIKPLVKQISQSPTVTTIAPVDFSASSFIYKQNQDVVFQTIVSNDVTQLKYYVNGALVGIINNPKTNQDFVWSSDKFPGFYTLEILAIGSGCYTRITKVIYVSNGPVVTIINPVENSWINSGEQINVSVDVKENGSAITSVNLYTDAGVSAVASYNPSQKLWLANLSSANPAYLQYNISARALDLSGNNTVKTTVINIAKKPTIIATVSGSSSATTNFNTVVPVDLSGVSNNGGTITGYYVNGYFVSAVSNSATYDIPVAYLLTSGNNDVEVIGVDQYGALTQESVFINVLPFAGEKSYPIIRFLGADPENKISSDVISATFEISDYTNKIIKNSIGLTETSRGILSEEIQTIDSGKKYIVTVIVSASGYVQISAMNYFGKTATFTEENFIIRCSKGRKLNLVNYLPPILREDNIGNESEFSKFTRFFEDYLNTMYKSFDESCNLSVLEKISKLKDLHDIDRIDPTYVQRYANMLGYGVDINHDELGTFSKQSLGYSDTSASYQNKVLRFVVGNLPNWYSIKTTRNAVKVMLLSFGIIGDIIEYYTLDYDKKWKQNRTVGDQYVSDEMTKEWYPTPHISVGIDLLNNDNEVIYNKPNIGNVVNAMEDIRPANVVINGIQGYVSETPVQMVYLNVSFRTTKSINVPRDHQINIK